MQTYHLLLRNWLVVVNDRHTGDFEFLLIRRSVREFTHRVRDVTKRVQTNEINTKDKNAE